jgi:DNA-directed RNA polymerase subunit RPC12/RpoP
MDNNYVTDPEVKIDNLQVEKCGTCGSNLTFDPIEQKLFCEHCGYTRNITDSIASEQNFAQLLAGTNDWNEEVRAFKCNNCGAEILFEKQNISTKCPYCGTGTAVASEALSGPVPNAVLPFAISKEIAKANYEYLVRKKLFCPNAFKYYSEFDTIKGIYNPAYTFDSSTFTQYYGELEKAETRTVHRNGRTETETYYRRFRIKGTFSLFFDDILVDANTFIPPKKLEKVKPFSTNKSKDYNKSFLLGYNANLGTKHGTQCWGEGKARMEMIIRNKILARYNYTRVVTYEQTVYHSNITYKYILLPLYIGCKVYNGKTYNFIANGDTGRLTADYPKSATKIVLFILGILAGIGLIAFALWYFVINKSYSLSLGSLLKIIKEFKGVL